MTVTQLSAGRSHRAGWLARVARLIGSAFEILSVWHARRRERTHLASLDDRMLHDIGLTRADVERELSKPVWRI
jgi:uncharacterized protein YjiS (DUF1127 family)